MPDEKEKGKKEEKKEHKHIWNSKGYCKICGADKEREGEKGEDKKEMEKEGKEHPEFGKKTIKKIVEDHEKK
jgi:hypothetical protein